MSIPAKCRFCDRTATVRQRSWSNPGHKLLLTPLCERHARQRPQFEIVSRRDPGRLHWQAYNDQAWKRRTKGAM